jgi:hypothetical protein
MAQNVHIRREPAPVLEERGQLAPADIRIFVYGGSKDSSAMLSKPCGVIGASTKQRTFGKAFC